MDSLSLSISQAGSESKGNTDLTDTIQTGGKYKAIITRDSSDAGEQYFIGGIVLHQRDGKSDINIDNDRTVQAFINPATCLANSATSPETLCVLRPLTFDATGTETFELPAIPQLTEDAEYYFDLVYATTNTVLYSELFHAQVEDGTAADVFFSAAPAATSTSSSPSTSSTHAGEPIPIISPTSSSSDTAQKTAFSPTPTPTTVSTDQPSVMKPSANTHSGGLAPGAKAGIGVGVGVGVLLLLIVAFILFRRRKRTRGAAYSQEMGKGSAGDLGAEKGAAVAAAVVPVGGGGGGGGGGVAGETASLVGSGGGGGGYRDAEEEGSVRSGGGGIKRKSVGAGGVPAGTGSAPGTGPGTGGVGAGAGPGGIETTVLSAEERERWEEEERRLDEDIAEAERRRLGS